MNTFDIEVVVESHSGKRMLYMNNFGLLEDGSYRILGCVHPAAVQDRYYPRQTLRSEPLVKDDVIVGHQLFALALHESLEHHKGEKTYIEGLVKSIRLVYRD